MSRPKKYRRNRYLFRKPPKRIYRPEDRIMIEKYCLECRKPLTKKQIYRGCVCCSYKCSNKRKGRKQRGVKRKMLRVLSDD